MGGPTAQAQSTQQGITQQQLQVSQQAENRSETQYQQQQQLQAPAIAHYTALTQSPNSPDAVAASAPAIANITQGTNAAKEQIMNNLPAGAARDYALSQIPLQKNAQVAGTLNSTSQGAFDKLANIGAGLGSFSLQDLGASLSGLQGANASNQVTLQTEGQGKADTMGLLGSLLGAGASVASAGITKSDRFAKENFRPMGPALDLAEQIEVLRYDYRPGHGRADQVGVVAQDLEQILPGAVARMPGGYLGVDYYQVAALALAAVRELSARVRELERQRVEA